jgi:hypothetical protein
MTGALLESLFRMAAIPDAEKSVVDDVLPIRNHLLVPGRIPRSRIYLRRQVGTIDQGARGN